MLERKLSSLVTQDFTTAGGVKAIVEVLNRVDRTTEKSIIETLEVDNPELAEEIKRLMFVFEDIVQMDDRSLQMVCPWPSRLRLRKWRTRFTEICRNVPPICSAKKSSLWAR